MEGAPNAEADGALSQQEEAELHRYPGLSYGEARSTPGCPGARARRRRQAAM